MRKIIACLMAFGILAGCTNPDGSPDGIFNKTNAGTLLGGGAGAWAGSNIGKGNGKIVATAVGGVLGALLGNQIGAALDERDQLLLGQTTQNTLETAPSSQPVPWRNPDSGHYGEVVAQPVYTNNNGQCRDYTQTIFIEGRAETARGTACRQADGTWKTVG